MMSNESSILELTQQLAQHLRISGVRGIPRAWFDLPNSPGEAPCGDDAEVILGDVAAQSEKSHTNEKEVDVSSMSWETLEQTALSCQRCRLCEQRNRVVFGVGLRDQPRIVFVGEGPGADEDRLGEPFVGKAGALLTGAITKGMGLSRAEVYICNVVKCRPPENRTPAPDEVQACVPFLKRQLELLQPSVIVTLGSPAQLALTGVAGGITKIRGRWLTYLGIPLMPTFHPAYILRNPDAKRPFWEDLKEVMKRLSIPEPGKE